MQREQNLCLLPEANSQMFTPASDASTDLTIDLTMNLLIHYSFDLSGYSASELVDRWQKEYPISWLHLAVIEALYQGRYKAISVQQILTLWQRRGQATFHYNMEFERLICSKFPESLTSLPSSPILPVKTTNSNYVLKNPPSLPEKLSSDSYSQSSNGKSNWEARKIDVPEKTYKPEVQEEDNSLYITNSFPSQQLLSSVKENKNGNSGEANYHHSSGLDRLTNLLPPAVNHPPIGQFTPQTSDRGDSFTSKLKAMSFDPNVQEAESPS
ncbi:MAG: hypothetical protein QNJ47_03845 [Nostocaceae cyanobacterium]|nr:hypothetical protein [Nostocaceae cyanobacterium]